MIATFFGGAVRDTTTKEYHDSVQIGRLLASQGYTVKNGGYFGLMEAVSKGASEISQYNAIGYTCQTFPSIKGNSYLTTTVVCSDIYERLRLLINDSDIFIVQKGGIGTLSELFLTLDVIRKCKNKPRIYLIGDMYKLLIPIFDIVMTDCDYVFFCSDFDDFEMIFGNK